MKTFDAAIVVAKADPRQAPKLLQAFGEPFAAYYADESRRATACVIAEGVGPAAVAQFVESFEPYVPWSEEFLSYRQQAYRDAGHRLAAQADRDLQEFVRCRLECSGLIGISPLKYCTRPGMILTRSASEGQARD